MKPSLLLCVMLPIFATFVSADEVKLPEKKDFQLFLLAGQSNMAGRGKLDEAARLENPRVLALNKEQKWQLAMDPLHWDKAGAGTGIGKPFAEIIAAQNPSVTIGLIPTACGGSPIDTWLPGKFWGQTKSHPWDDSVASAKLAMKSGTLKAILWHQGESDSTTEDAPKYEERLTDLINRFRSELEAPELPFIIGQLGNFPAKPWDANREMVDAAQKSIAAKMKNVRFVSSEGFTSVGDNLHFDTPSLRIFAQRYADAYLDIVGKKP